MAHSVTDDSGNTVTYGVANIDYLFPDARNVNNTPDFISRDMSWVTKVMNGAKHLPFSRVKSTHAMVTELIRSQSLSETAVYPKFSNYE